jgi:hypothetical protein
MEDKWKTRSTSVWCPSFLLLSFYLVHQNRELSKELKRKQLKIQEYEEQSEFYHGQISKIEQFLEFIDRVWQQFDSTLLETLGYPQLHIEEQQHDEAPRSTTARGKLSRLVKSPASQTPRIS